MSEIKPSGTALISIGAIVSILVIGNYGVNKYIPGRGYPETPEIATALKFSFFAGIAAVIWGSIILGMKKLPNEEIIDENEVIIPEYAPWIIVGIVYGISIAWMAHGFTSSSFSVADYVSVFMIILVSVGVAIESHTFLAAVAAVLFILVSQTHSNMGLVMGAGCLMTIPLV